MRPARGFVTSAQVDSAGATPHDRANPFRGREQQERWGYGMSSEVDVIVLGSGNAGFAAVGAAHNAGKSALIVESRDIGGTCPLRGCVPKKVLVAAAECLHQIALAPEHHISVGPATLDWKKLIARKQTFVDGVPDDFRGSLERRGIQVAEGPARFTGPHEVAVNGQTFAAKKTVIATGSKARPMPIPGFENAINSDDILDLQEQPKSIVFIGAGVIAMEFTHVFARAGTKVTIIELADRPLPGLEAEVVEKLVEATTALGVDIYAGAQTDSIEKMGNQLKVNFTHGGQKKSVTAELVANGAGRIAAVEDLDLEAGGIDHDGFVIDVDEFMRSRSNPDVFVAGDAAQGPQLSPVASYQGRIVGHNLVNGSMISADYSSIPSAVFTVPTLASVGLTEEKANAAGLKFDAKTNDMTSWRSSMTHAENAAFAKVLVEQGSGKILGAHILGHGAGEIIHLFSWAMSMGMTAKDIGAQIYVYPTFANDIKFLV